MNRDDGDKRGRVRVVDAPSIRRTPMAPGRTLEVVILDDPDGRILGEARRLVDAPADDAGYYHAHVSLPAAAFLAGEDGPYRHYCGDACADGCPRIRRQREPRSIRAEAQRNRRRRQALQRLERRAARRARRVAHVTALLHQLAEHDAREPAPGWKDAVLAATTDEETR